MRFNKIVKDFTVVFGGKVTVRKGFCISNHLDIRLTVRINCYLLISDTQIVMTNPLKQKRSDHLHKICRRIGDMLTINNSDGSRESSIVKTMNRVSTRWIKRYIPKDYCPTRLDYLR